jgi:hypothetical protein
MPFPFCFLYELLPILPTEDPSKIYMEESRKVPMRPRKNKLPDGAISKAVSSNWRGMQLPKAELAPLVWMELLDM